MSIIELKKFEKICVKVTKLDCDIKYFESCQEMELIPEFLKFKVPNLKIYSDSDSFYLFVVKVVKTVFLTLLNTNGFRWKTRGVLYFITKIMKIQIADPPG